MFHALNGLTAQEAQAANVRQFVGDGTPYLKVPGLSDGSIKSVRLGNQYLPLEMTQSFPLNPQGTQFEDVTSPMILAAPGPDGVMILLRSIQSNDGIWQKDVPVYVQAEWDAAPAAETATAE